MSRLHSFFKTVLRPFERLGLRGLTLIAALSCAAQPAPLETLPRPLSLDDALAYALAHNPALRRVKAQLAQQEGVLLETTALRRPTVGARGSYGYTQARLFESLPGFPEVPLPDPNAWEINLTVRQSVYSGGRVRARVRSAQERVDAARSTMIAAINQTLFAVEESFYDVLLAREQIKVNEEALRVLETENEQAGVRRRAGTGSDFEVLRARVALANARPALVRALLGEKTEPNDDEQTDLDVQGELTVPRVSFGLADAIRAARAHRPELLADESIIAAMRDEIESARRASAPK
jgi:outer membrane protein